MTRRLLGTIRRHIKRHTLVSTLLLLLLVVGFEYYYYYTTLSKDQTPIVIDLVKSTKHERSFVLPDNPGETKSSQSLTQRETTFNIKTESPDDVEAEKDSVSRKDSVNEVCKNQNAPNVLKQSDDKLKKSRLQKFNLFHHIMVNEEHKVLFCFIPKVGCSNMKRIFLVMQGLYPSVNEVNIHLMNSEILRLNNKKFTDEHREYMLDNFYKFMLVRDPFERLVSAYRNKWQNKRNIQLHKTLGKIIVERYRYNNTKTVTTGDNVTFTEYVKYLVDTPPEEVNEHWMRYEDLCRPCEVKYDFIGSIDTLMRDVRHAIRQIHANETKYYMIKISDGALTRSKRTTANFLRELSEKDFDKLQALYKIDHQLFGYPLPEYNALEKRYPAK